MIRPGYDDQNNITLKGMDYAPENCCVLNFRQRPGNSLALSVQLDFVPPK